MKITDWIQAIGSVASVAVAYLAFRISKNALNISKETLDVSEQAKNIAEAGVRMANSSLYLTKELSHIAHRCIIYPERFYLHNGQWAITFRNNGVGLAFNVRVELYVRDRENVFGDPNKKTAIGSRVINPNSEQTFIVEESGLSLLIFEETPATISWETLSGAKYEAKWIFSQRASGEELFSLLEETKIEE
ncbi:hypothetical protein [Paenibacillus sp. Root444D2]|uniref:hypothetical protein n=1 Tax=Paenibacillus sp. Root444D2 TaxID=1736538 RepID=UPI00070CD131|nr:hypothetical protein [Paenibacillus sp. Root444D2]KQX45862.1 hypothetical protein ASD40_18675 [Paenibacillus sp. Root444D2]